MTAAAVAPDSASALKRQLSFADATAIVISSVIGSGVFFTPGQVANDIPDPKWLILAWVLGGVLSLGGAFINAELGASFPHAGGDYVFLREAFHPMAGFLVGWMTFFIIYAGSLATMASGLAESLPRGAVPPSVIAISLIALVSTINYVSVRIGATLNRLTTYLKVGALAILGVIGLTRGMQPLGGGGAPVLASHFALGFVPIVFAYSGWNATVYVAGEISEPKKNIPRSLIIGLFVCTLAYVLLNVAWMKSIPFVEFRGAKSVGETSARAVLGPAGGKVIAAFIGLTVFGCLAANALVGARIAYALGQDGMLPGMGRVHARFVTPHRAVVLQAIVAIAIVVGLDSFSRVLDYTTFALLIATMADAVALVALRRKEPGRERPYLCPGYPWLPAVYIFANGAIAFYMMKERTFECLASLAVLALGLPFYVVLARRRARTAT